MPNLKTRTWSTPLIIGSSVVVGVSGILLFFHLAEDLVKEMHEWLGLLFVAAIVLHVLNHWEGFRRYFSKAVANGVIVSVLAIAGVWIALSGSEGGEGGHPAKRMISVVEQAPLNSVAELNGLTREALIKRFEDAGIQVTSTSESLSQLAKENNKHPFELFEIVLSK